MIFLGIILLPLDGLAGPGSVRRTDQRPRPFIKGMALGHYTDIKPAHLDAKLKEISGLGVSHVSLVVSWSMEHVNATNISPRLGYVTPDNVLRRMIRQVKAKGLSVFLFPILDVRKRKIGQWRGTIKPGSWDQWWRNYYQFILHYAEIAAQEKVDLFCVGSELVSTETMHGRWKVLITRVRKKFKGELVYSANWDHYEPVTFWDLVDRIGLTAYYKLSDNSKASEKELLKAWQKVRNKLVSWSRKLGRPFIFTEVGYPSRDGGAVEPWDYTKSTPVDLEEQRRALSAFARAWHGKSQLNGVVFWDWYGQGGKNCTRYTTKGKPAAQVIVRWFSSPQKRPAR